MALPKLVENVNHIDSDHEYWFVRTDSGVYYDTYIENKFIGIGWNYITLEDLRNKTIEEIKTKIARREDLNLNDPSERGKVTAIYNKLDRFYKLRKGDRVMIPSYNSDAYSFGIISDARMFVVNEKTHDCDFYKRHRVNWVAHVPMRNLDAIFYKIRMSRHAISSVKEYAPYLDKVMDTVFVKNGNSHFVLEIKKQEDINLKSITTLTTQIELLLSRINEHFELNENIGESYIKLSLQSRGTVEIILKNGKSLLILAAVLSLGSLATDVNNNGRNPQVIDREVQVFIEENKAELDSINQAMDELEVDRNRINSDL